MFFFLFFLVMYPAYAKWVQSHRDLPIKLNQWCNVVVSDGLCDGFMFTGALFFLSLPNVLHPPRLLTEMGVQTPPALPEDERVPVARGTHSVCHQRRGG